MPRPISLILEHRKKAMLKQPYKNLEPIGKRLLKVVSVVFFLFHQKEATKILWEILFISLKTLFRFLIYSNFCNYFLPAEYFNT